MKKVVIITGASSGIGLETANYFGQNGCTVYGISRNKFDTNLFTHIVGDVTNSARMEEIFEEIHAKEHHIDIVINNAGIGISGAIEYATKEDVARLFNINVTAVINICSIATQYLRESQGKIINISSVAGVVPLPFQACYSASKAAIENFSMALANELRPQKVKVVCVRPGDTKTGFTDARIKNEVVDDIYKDRIKKSVSKMEHDEQNGVAPIKVAKVVFKVAKRNNPPCAVTVGFNYKFICLLVKLLPARLVNYILYKMY